MPFVSITCGIRHIVYIKPLSLVEDITIISKEKTSIIIGSNIFIISSLITIGGLYYQ